MSRGPAASRFKQRDLTAAVRAARAAGIEIRRIEIDTTGRIILTTCAGASRRTEPDLDKWLAAHADQA